MRMPEKILIFQESLSEADTTAFEMLHKFSSKKFYGVVKSPICCVEWFTQLLDILHVLSSS